MAAENNRKRRGRGEGGVHYDEARSLWVASVSLGNFVGTNKRNRKVVYGKTKKEALDKAATVREKHGAGVVQDRDVSRLTAADVVAEWLRASEPRTARRTHETRSDGAALVGPFFRTMKAKDVRPHHVEQFHAHLAATVKPSYAWHAARAFAAAFKRAADRGDVPNDPTAKIRIPPMPQREMLTLTPEQVKALLAATEGYSFYPLLMTALATGMRQGELLGLHWDDVDLDGGTITVRRSLSWTKAHGFQSKQPKTDAARRTIAMPASCVVALRRHRREREAAGMLHLTVFSTQDGTHQFRGKISNHVKRAIRRANKGGANIPHDFRFHDTRHTHASILLSRGQSLRAVSRRLGHVKPSLTLSIYAHCLPGDDTRLAVSFEGVLE